MFDLCFFMLICSSTLNNVLYVHMLCTWICENIFMLFSHIKRCLSKTWRCTPSTWEVEAGESFVSLRAVWATK